MGARHTVGRLVTVLVVVGVSAASATAAAPARGRIGASRASPPLASGLPPLYWSGRLWQPRATTSTPGTDASSFRPLPDTVFVDAAGALHLRIAEVDGTWWASEVASVQEDFGYGTYRWVVDTPVRNLDPASVLGMFTYNGLRDPSAAKGDPHVGHLEADFELTKWRGPRAPFNLQETVQPYWSPWNVRRMAVPAGIVPLTYELIWSPTGTGFVVRRGTGATARVLTRWWTPALVGTPRLGTRVNVDLWSFRGPPVSGRSQEAVVRSFEFVPAG